jgi:signal transduction histidine kinase
MNNAYKYYMYLSVLMYSIHGRIKPKTSWNYNKTDKFFFLTHSSFSYSFYFKIWYNASFSCAHYSFFFSFLFSWWIKIFIQISLNFLTLPSKGLIFLRSFTPRWFITCLYAVFYIFLRSSTCDKSLIPLREFQSTL